MPPTRTRKEPLQPDKTSLPYTQSLATKELPKSVPAYLLTTPPVFKNTALPTQKAIDILAAHQSWSVASSDTTIRCALGYARESGAWFYPSSTLSSSSPYVDPRPYFNACDYYPPFSVTPSGEPLKIQSRNFERERLLTSRANGEFSAKLPTLTPKKSRPEVARARVGSLLLESPVRSEIFSIEVPQPLLSPMRLGSLTAKPPH